MPIRFGRFEADRAQYRVREGGRPLELTPKLLDLLFYFLDRPGRLLTKEELLDGVWPGANVTDNALAQAVSELRDALGDSASSPLFIRTVARRGYRFVADVDGPPGPGAPPAPAPAPSDDDMPTLAVLDFTNMAGDSDIAWLGAGIAETVTGDLGSLNRFRVIDRWRVAEAARRTGGSLHDVGAALGARLMVTGAYQRSGSSLRITARLVDLSRGEALADAKVDGQIEDVFSLQDGIVLAFAHELGVPLAPGGARVGVRETASLEAYRAYIEGWLKIESLDLEQNTAAMRDFQRAIEIDARYAIAYTGLANVEFVAFESTRATLTPNLQALRSGIEHARHAIHLDNGLAEAHATLSFLLTSAMSFEEARRAAQQAVALEPDNWRHLYRLGHALWGDARLRAFERALALYPQFAYARFEMAMVLVARGDAGAAADIVQVGAGEQDRQTHMMDRFPVVGFHWLLGALRAARGDEDSAIAEFDREASRADRRVLYRPEYAAEALVAKGQALLRLDRETEAMGAFQAALGQVEGYARALVGRAAVLERAAHPEAGSARQDVRDAIGRLERQNRTVEWLMVSACEAGLAGDGQSAAAHLDRLLDRLPPSAVAWTIPIEPCFVPIQDHPAFQRVLARLAERAK